MLARKPRNSTSWTIENTCLKSILDVVAYNHKKSAICVKA